MMRRILKFVAGAAVIAAGVYLYPAVVGVGEGGRQRPRDSLPVNENPSVSQGDGVQPSDGNERWQSHIPGSPMTPSAGSARNDSASAPFAATERAMLTGGAINEVATEALQSKQFDRLLTQFEVEQGGMTAEITTAYRAELQRLLGSVGEPNQIDRLVCGTDLCIASIRSPSRDWFSAWYESVQHRSSLPMTALTRNAIDLGGSGVEYRLLFSISNDVKGFMGSAPRS